MGIKITTLCLLFVTVFFSCKKDPILNTPTSGNPGSTAIPVLSKVLINNLCSNEYVYNDSYLVSEEKSEFDYTMNHYNAKGQLISSEYYTNDDVLSSDAQISATAINSTALVTAVNGKKAGIITYEYNANSQLTKTTYSLPAATSSEYSDFSYDSYNRINRQTMYWADTETGYIDYSYDTKGNLILESLYNMPSTGVAELITSTSYAFDNSQNPFKFFSRLMVPGITTNQNNIIKETYTIHLTPDQGPDKIEVTETSYQYNALGYPATKNSNVSFVYE
jgi:hypothetical protein